MLAPWDERYPSREVLRSEVESMLAAFVEALFEAIPEAEIDGIYAKGSAFKEWDSPLDYVPELSDVDIHVLFKDVAAVKRHLGTLQQALNIQAQVEALYFARVPVPVHVPRPQLMIANHLLTEKDYVPSPTGMVRVIYGKDYSGLDTYDPERIRRIDCQHLLDQEALLDRLPLMLIDKPFKYIWRGLRTLSWRVSPVGPRVLSLLGAAYDDAWGMNRTEIVSRLSELGEHRLADDYSQFYLAGWDYFLSDGLDTDAGRLCLASGARVIDGGISMARAWLGARGSARC